MGGKRWAGAAFARRAGCVVLEGEWRERVFVGIVGGVVRRSGTCGASVGWASGGYAGQGSEICHGVQGVAGGEEKGAAGLRQSRPEGRGAAARVRCIVAGRGQGNRLATRIESAGVVAGRRASVKAAQRGLPV